MKCKKKNTKSAIMNKDNVKIILNIFIHSTRALSMANCGLKVEKCASMSLTFTYANSAYSYFISACVSVCMICWPHWSHDTLVNGETSLAESCCHSCLAWTRRGSKSLERLSNTPANGTATSSTSTHLTSANSSHSQKLHIAQSKGSGWRGRSTGGLGARVSEGKGEFEGQRWGLCKKGEKQPH